jgi:hypothetical protein
MWCRRLVGSAVREHLGDCPKSADRDIIRNHVVRVDVQANQLVVELKTAAPSGPPSAADNARPVVRITKRRHFVALRARPDSVCVRD